MHESLMEQLWRTSHMAGVNAGYLEELFEAYLSDPNSIPEEWRKEFDKLPGVSELVTTDVSHAAVKKEFLEISKAKRTGSTLGGAGTEHERKQVRVQQLVTAYRMRGHQKAQLDPLNIWDRQPPPDLSLAYHELSSSDMDTTFSTALYIGKENATLREIIDSCESTYCRSIGAEITHITDTSERRWIEQRLESMRGKPEFSEQNKKHILERLVAAEGLEKYLHSRYSGAKRFGLEGGEALIPMLDELIQRSGTYGVQEIVLGMAHRGRLNVLINTMGKSPRDLFDEFEGKSFYERGSGDVKYHQGFSTNVMTAGGEVHVAMAFNPSHLEIVSPVVEGSVRARQDRRGDETRDGVVPVVMHGDAAFAGQGVVMETFQMSQTRAYATGGTVHIVINNQVGFTTSKAEDARSTEYCTDIAKMVQAPILHVNGDDPEAVVFATQIAIDYRMRFKRDIVIDLICYRRNGHNEADEPSGTQPLMYAAIKKQKSTVTLYADQLKNETVVDDTTLRTMMDEYREALDNGRHVAKALVTEPNTSMFVDWAPYLNQPRTDEFESGVGLAKLKGLAAQLDNVPEGFSLQRQVSKIVQDRQKMAAGAIPINWGYAETLAYATVLEAGNAVRITGQDVGRGTFSHRHAVLHNQKDGSNWVPLQNLSSDQPRFTIHDSFLSEEAVLAFEYGYATTTPSSMVIWEAQFGDFANGAQVVIDQFITSGEEKWGRLCGLTMLLPHGYEGQGPEHSSARLERFLQLCAEHNIQVCVPTTPAQVYHMLVRQAVRKLRKPLVVMSPKSLLRNKDAVSSLEDIANGEFQTVLSEVNSAIEADKVERVVLCSGKVYYDLAERRAKDNLDNVAIVRIEQLYPFPEEKLYEALAPYKNVKDVVWCQEEPMNQGAWYPSQHHMRHVIAKLNPALHLRYAGRTPAASPAAGYMKLHIEQLEQFLADALYQQEQ